MLINRSGDRSGDGGDSSDGGDIVIDDANDLLHDDNLSPVYDSGQTSLRFFSIYSFLSSVKSIRCVLWMVALDCILTVNSELMDVLDFFSSSFFSSFI